MSVFTNQNYITQIFKQLGCLDFVDPESFIAVQALVQAQAFNFTQNCTRHANNDKRDILTPSDIQTSLIQLRHNQMNLYFQGDLFRQQNNQYLLQDFYYRDMVNFLNKQLGNLNPISAPNLKGRYIYIQKRIPKITQNHQLKSLQQIKQIKVRQDQQKKKNFNVIRDQPQSQFTKEELEYLAQFEALISSTSNQKQIDQSQSCNIRVNGCITNLLPIILMKISQKINENSISYLIGALQNSYVWNSLQFHMDTIMSILLAYRGKLSYKVGLIIGYIVNRFGSKYYNLYDVFQTVQDTFNNITKKIGFEVVTGCPVQIDMKKIKNIEVYAEQNNQQAIICLNTIINHWGRLQSLKNKQLCQYYGYGYWLCCKQLKQDKYLNMY